MEEAKEQLFRTYAWAYFAYHADQRLKTFNFFLLAAGLLAGAITTFLKDSGDPRWVCPLGLVLTVLSFVFWKIDRRNRSLVRNAEAAIKHLDSLHGLRRIDETPHVLEIFARDDFQTGAAFKGRLWNRELSYSKCLGTVFLLFGALGAFFAIGSFLFPPANLTKAAPNSPGPAGSSTSAIAVQTPSAPFVPASQPNPDPQSTSAPPTTPSTSVPKTFNNLPGKDDEQETLPRTEPKEGEL